MKREWIVKANEGFRSDRMPFIQAVRYATSLIKLGNYSVRLEEVE